jgi:type I restriction enzyme M protein
MDPAHHARIVSFIWGVADDVLRDIYVRGHYRDVILPLTVIRRLDALLEPTKQAVLDTHAQLTAKGISLDHQDKVLCKVAGFGFYNTSKFTLRGLRDHQTQLRDNFETYLKAFSPNVREIIGRFGFLKQLDKLEDKKLIDMLLEKFTSREVNFSPKPVIGKTAEGKEFELHPAMTNHDMGYVFEELLRRFNEENNEEAGEHFTPREVVRLMASLLFLPVKDEIKDSTYLVYDCACGSGGMLTEAEAMLHRLGQEHGRKVTSLLYGQEINDETYAICKADMLIKGEDESNIRPGTTLAEDAFPRTTFDFMLANPPYGKSWKGDLERMGGKDAMKDPRFVITHDGDPEYSLATRSSDGQLMFLVNMLSKMKHDTPGGSRVATVHNGSALFTGDAGQGESNIRRWIIENDWLEAIVALPLGIFYNTGIATYVWVLSNRKPKSRRGKVQLIDATAWSRPLRKNLGKKNCELSADDLGRICETFLGMKESEQSKVFDNRAFGYWKVTVERPLRLRVDLDEAARKAFTRACGEVGEAALAALIDDAVRSLGQRPYKDYNLFLGAIESIAARADLRLTPKRVKLLQNVLAKRDESAEPVLKKVHKAGKAKADPLHGLFAAGKDVVEYEKDADLRDTEQVPLLEEGGIAGFMAREVLPHAPDAWVDPDATQIGYEVSFNRYFYKPQAQRSLEEIRADILAVERETEGLLREILGGAA